MFTGWSTNDSAKSWWEETLCDQFTLQFMGQAILSWTHWTRITFIAYRLWYFKRRSLSQRGVFCWLWERARWASISTRGSVSGWGLHFRHLGLGFCSIKSRKWLDFWLEICLHIYLNRTHLVAPIPLRNRRLFMYICWSLGTRQKKPIINMLPLNKTKLHLEHSIISRGMWPSLFWKRFGNVYIKASTWKCIWEIAKNIVTWAVLIKIEMIMHIGSLSIFTLFQGFRIAKRRQDQMHWGMYAFIWICGRRSTCLGVWTIILG